MRFMGVDQRGHLDMKKLGGQPWSHSGSKLLTHAIFRKAKMQTRRSCGTDIFQTSVHCGTIKAIRMAGLNQAQLFRSCTSTMITVFERGLREGVNKNSSGTCADVRTLCKAGRLKEALQILNQGDISSDFNTYVCLLRECTKMKGLAEGKQVHAHIIQNGFKPNTFLLNSLVNMYAKCGSVVDARLVFEKMLDRDLFTWNIIMAGYAKHGFLREALKIYEQMIQEGVRPNKVTFTCIVNVCASLTALEKGIEVHVAIRKAGVVPDIILDTALVTMYAKCGSVKDARHVFDNMAHRNVVSWTAMMAGYDRHGWSREAFEIYKHMIREGVMPDRVTFICALNACASLAALEKGKEVHADIVKAGIAPDSILENTLVDMYAKCGSVKEARQVFNNMALRDVVSWNVMITGYAQHGCGREALEAYEQMLQEGMTPDKVTFICILNACASMMALEKGKEVHADIMKAGIAPEDILETALVDMYARCGSIKDARQVFDNMAKQDVVSWNVMIAGYSRHGCGREVFEIYQQMLQEGMIPDKVTFACILNVCASMVALEKGKEAHAAMMKAGIASEVILDTALVDMYAKCGSMKDARQVFDSMAQRNVVSWNAIITGYAQHGCGREALQLFELMKEEGLKPNVVSWSAMVAGYAQHGYGMEAVGMYDQMVLEGVMPDIVTFNSVLKACASLAALGLGKEVHADIVKTGIATDVILETALADMYAKCGSMKDARQVFNNMAYPTVVSWSAMMAGYAQHGCGREALQLFEQMQQEGLKPNVVTFICLLSACSRVGLVDEGCHYFHCMIREYGLTPTVEHFGCMVDLLGRAGHLDEAVDFINRMPIEPDAAVWRALLGACRIYGNVGVAERAAKWLLKWDPHEAGTYVLLSSIYAAAGRWNDTAKVKRMMMDRDVKKDPDCCCIVVDKRVHKFVADDKSHPQIEEIHAELKRLSCQMKEARYTLHTNFLFQDVEEQQNDLSLCYHGEKLAIAFGLVSTSPGTPLGVVKNLRCCGGCHMDARFISKVVGRAIVVRDASGIHCFQDGVCSCGDYW